MQKNNSLLRKLQQDSDGLVGNLSEEARRKTVRQIKAARGEDPLMGGLDKFRAMRQEAIELSNDEGEDTYDEDEKGGGEDDVDDTKAGDEKNKKRTGGRAKMNTFTKMRAQLFKRATIRENSRFGRLYTHVFHPDSLFLNL